MAYQRREYKLVNVDNGTSIILNSTGTNNEPKGWDESDYTIKRSVKNFSITTTLSNNLEFTGSGARFLLDAYNSKGVEANVKMFETRFNPNTDAPYIFTIVDFDFSEMQRTKTTVQIPFTSGGLNQLLKAKLKDKFEFTRLESITGETIQPLQTSEFAVINRPIYLDSKAETAEANRQSVDLIINIFEDGKTIGVPSTVIYDSDDRFVSALPNQIDDTPTTGLSATCFYYLNDIDKVFNLSISFSSFITALSINNTDLLALDLVIYENGAALDVKQRIRLKEYLNINDTTINELVEVSYNDESFELKENESLALQWYANTPDDLTFFTLKQQSIDFKIQITEFSTRNDLPRRSKCILNKNVGKQGMSIINNDPNTYYSDFFNNGDFKLSGVTSGKWIRGFLDDSITFSFKDWLENCNSLFNMGYNIELVNGKETLVHEPLKHFFRPETKIYIKEQVSNVKRSVAKEFVFNTIRSGYKKPSGDNLYEEVNGLNEFNTSNEYITPITRVVQEYDIESPFRADSEGKELTVRKSIRLFPTEDYRTDKTIFNLDLKDEGTNVLAERVWQDDYETEPQGVFSPDTATGLRLTPYRNMERHFWFINNSLTKYPDKYIRYSSSRGNSDLITKKAGEEEKKENGNFKINSLENAIFVNEWIEFEYPVDFDLINQVNGYSEVNGRRIPNMYFKVEFVNEFNQKEYGYLFELQPNKEGKWKLLKAI
jgi:hypothetical protein